MVFIIDKGLREVSAAIIDGDWGEMMSGVRITGAAANPNPVSHNTDFVLTVAVAEEQQVRRPLLTLSNMYFSDMLYGG